MYGEKRFSRTNSYANELTGPGWKISTPIKLASSDESLVEACHRALAPPLASAARKLIESIRKLDAGGRFEETDRGKFVNRPNNFVTLKVQPRKGDVLVTIYGNPDLYESPLDLKRDQNGYTRLNWGRPEDLEEVRELVDYAFDCKKRRANRDW